MTDDEQKKIFANNLTRFVNQSGKLQKEIAKELNVPIQTFNGWCNGVSIPSMGKVQMLADYFHIGKSDLLEVNSDVMNKAAFEYLTKAIESLSHFKVRDSATIDYIFDHDNILALVEVAKKSSDEDIKMAIDLLKRLNKEN